MVAEYIGVVVASREHDDDSMVHGVSNNSEIRMVLGQAGRSVAHVKAVAVADHRPVPLHVLPCMWVGKRQTAP
jgi:hypothetical protein